MSAIFTEDSDLRHKEIIFGIVLIPTIMIASVDFDVGNFVQINVDWGVGCHDVWFELGWKELEKSQSCEIEKTECDFDMRVG